tara:strand:- start:51 stop:248 length:198 start_codon:yes stop_codon:yes gene_type:complete
MSKKKKINESMLDTAVKGVVGYFFGKKIISQAAKKRAMRDPKVKKIVADIKADLAKFDQLMSDYE